MQVWPLFFWCCEGVYLFIYFMLESPISDWFFLNLIIKTCNFMLINLSYSEKVYEQNNSLHWGENFSLSTDKRSLIFVTRNYSISTFFSKEICKCFYITYNKSYINIVNVTPSLHVNKQCDFFMVVYTTFQKNFQFSEKYQMIQGKGPFHNKERSFSAQLCGLYHGKPKS